MFVAFAWIPKATVQAAIGGFVLSQAAEELVNSQSQETIHALNEYKVYGNDILMSAVVSIILTAPLGAILTSILGQKWLDQDHEYLR